MESLEEEEEQPKTLSSALHQTKLSSPTLSPRTTYTGYKRMLSVATTTSSNRGHRSLGSKQTSLSDVPEQQQILPGLYRSISVQPPARSNNMFSSNIHEVEKVLFRMANAIKMDLQLK